MAVPRSVRKSAGSNLFQPALPLFDVEPTMPGPAGIAPRQLDIAIAKPSINDLSPEPTTDITVAQVELEAAPTSIAPLGATLSVQGYRWLYRGDRAGADRQYRTRFQTEDVSEPVLMRDAITWSYPLPAGS